MTSARPDLSIVVAVWREDGGLVDCLQALQPQLDDEVEVLVVANLDLDPGVMAAFGWARWVACSPVSLTPALWSRGIEQARGELVAVTTGHFAPADDWVAQIRAAARAHDAVGIGGAIDPPRRGGAAAWATYYMRYSNYFHIDTARRVGEIAADNAVYRRSALMRHWAAIAEGFWEPEFHGLVFAEGHHLVYEPAIRVTQAAAFPFGTFCRQRYEHGARFGASRVAGRGALTRALRVATAPAVPLVFLAKICRRALRRPRDLARFVTALPALAAFAGCWAAGEAVGYARG